MKSSEKSQRCTTVPRFCELLLPIHKERFMSHLNYYRPYINQVSGFPLGTITGGSLSIAKGYVYFHTNPEVL
jgi:hypothetical protein